MRRLLLAERHQELHSYIWNNPMSNGRRRPKRAKTKNSSRKGDAIAVRVGPWSNGPETMRHILLRKCPCNGGCPFGLEFVQPATTPFPTLWVRVSHCGTNSRNRVALSRQRQQCQQPLHAQPTPIYIFDESKVRCSVC